MLSDETKKKIEDKVEAKKYKQSLENNKSFASSVWIFLNTNFGLWVISVVFVSSISTYITKLTLRLKEEKAEKERTYNLLCEFGGRYSRLYHFTNDNEKSTVNRLLQNSNELTKLLFNSSIDKKIAILYPEFNDNNLMSIAFQLEQSVKLDSLKNLFRAFRHDLYGLERAYTRANIKDSSRALFLMNKTTDFRIKWGDLLYGIGFFGDFDTYLGYKPDFDRSKFEDLFGYKKNGVSWFYFPSAGLLILFSAYLIFKTKTRRRTKKSAASIGIAASGTGH